MNKEEITKSLNLIFNKIFNNDITLKNDLTANDVDDWDSLTHMLLISEIESEFSIKFKLKDLNKMENVGDMINIIKHKII